MITIHKNQERCQRTYLLVSIEFVILGGCVKVEDPLYDQVIIQVIVLLNHIETPTVLSKLEESSVVYRPKWFWRNEYHYNLHISNFCANILRSFQQHVASTTSIVLSTSVARTMPGQFLVGHIKSVKI